MIIVQLQCGLGNQLFQYALGRQLSILNRTPLKLDISTGFVQDPYERQYGLHRFNIACRIAKEEDTARVRSGGGDYRLIRLSRRLKGLPLLGWWVPAYGNNILIERRQFVFDPWILQERFGNAVLSGYWQNEKYFKGIEPTIRSEFTLKHRMSARAEEYARMIRGEHAVGVHVRSQHGIAAGRVLAEGVRFHGRLSHEYYDQAVSWITDCFKDLHLFVFADDLAWAQANLRLASPLTWVTGNEDYEDLTLMSLCRHQIIANSSFSWWGAWLNSHPGRKVIAPVRHVQDPSVDVTDVYPPDWIRL